LGKQLGSHTARFVQAEWALLVQAHSGCVFVILAVDPIVMKLRSIVTTAAASTTAIILIIIILIIVITATVIITLLNPVLKQQSSMIMITVIAT